MKKTNPKKLMLKSATVRTLQDGLTREQLDAVAGGHECQPTLIAPSGTRANC